MFSAMKSNDDNLINDMMIFGSKLGLELVVAMLSTEIVAVVA